MPFQLVMKIPQMQAQHDEGVQRIVDKYAELIVNTMKRSMRAGKSGRFYPKKQKSIAGIPSFGKMRTTAYLHQASAPGQAPAVDTGDLFRSIRNNPDGRFARVVSAGGDAPASQYAYALEFGTVKMAPRPYFLPAFEQHKRAFRQELRDLFAGVPSFTSQPYGFNNQP